MSRLKNINKKRTSLINLAIFSALLVVIMLFSLPLFNEYNQINKDMNETLLKQKELDSQLTQIKGAKAELESSTEVAQSRAAVAIPEQFGQDFLITQINNLARRHQISISNMSFSNPRATGADVIRKATINMSLLAEKKDLINFLRALESNPRKLLVKSITAQLSRVDNVDRVTFSLSLEAFYQGNS